MQLSALSLSETIRLVRKRSGEAEDRVSAFVINAALVGERVATGRRLCSTINSAQAEGYYSLYFDHPALFDREIVPSSAWASHLQYRGRGAASEGTTADCSSGGISSAGSLGHD
jgi:hypothetical protein